MQFDPLSEAAIPAREPRHPGGLTPIAAVLLPDATAGVPIRLGRTAAFTPSALRLPLIVRRRRS